MDEIVQVLEVALRDVLAHQPGPELSINITIEQEDGDNGKPVEPAPWLAKQVQEHIPNSGADPNGILFHRTVSFTGDLESITRDEAAATIASLGGIPHTNVTHQTDVLVIGQGPGAKLETAESYVAAGQTIEIIDEATFLRYLSGWTLEREGRERPTPNAELQRARRAAEAAKASARAQSKEVGRLAAPVIGLVAKVELTCQACGKTWQRESQRGRLPLICPECRAAGVKV